MPPTAQLEVDRPMTPKEVADSIGRSVRWVQRRCNDGTIRTLPIGVPYMIPVEEVRRLRGFPVSSHER